MKKIIVLLIALIINLSNTADCATEKVFLTEEEIAREILFEKEPVDVREARTQAFKNVEYEIDPKTFEKYLKDKKFVAPPKEYGGKPKLKPRMGIVEVYSNNIYEVSSFKNIMDSLLYEKQTGKLIYISKTKGLNNFLISYIYDTNGKLKYISCDYKNNNKLWNGYMFNNKKEYIAYWLDDVLYNLNNKEILRIISEYFF